MSAAERATPWARVPTESAAPWYRMSYIDRLLAMALIVAASGREVFPGTLADWQTRLVRQQGASSRDRKRIASGFLAMRRAGLLFEHEGKVYLLFSEALHNQYSELGKHYASQMVTVVPAETRTHRALTEHSLSTQVEVKTRNHSGHPSGKKERVKQSTTCSGAAAPPAPQSPPPIIPLKKTRKKTPLDYARERLVVMFGELYGAKYAGLASRAKRQDLLTRAAKAYMRDFVLDEAAALASMRQHLADGWYTQKRPGYDSPPGHSFDHWAANHERYDQLAAQPDLPFGGFVYAS